MATSAEPLFVASLDVLKKEARLGEITDADAAGPIVNEACMWARVRMIEALGDAGVQTVLATAFTPTPLTSAEVLRVNANSLETLLFKRYLLSHLPWATMESSGSMPSWYNKEAPFRLSNSLDRERMIREIENQCNQLLGSICAALATEDGTCSVNGSRIGSAVLAPDDDPPQLGAIYGQLDLTKRWEYWN